MLDRSELLKIDLLVHGMKVSERVRDALSKGGQIPLSLFEYATTSGIPLKFSGTDIYVNSPFAEDFCKTATQELDFRDGVFFVGSGADEIRAEPIPLPSYFDKTNSDGIPYRDLAMTHTDRVRINPISGCAFSCEFCDAPQSSEYRKANLDDLLESIQVAIDDPVLPARHILISGGNPRPEDRAYLDEVYRETAKSFNIPVDVMMVPRSDNDYPERLRSWGINYLSINLEIYNEQISAKLTAGKNAIGREKYFSFMRHSVEVFGEGTIRCILLLGLEPLEDTLTGVEALASIGVSPVLSPFRPAPKTSLAHLSPPTAEQLAEAYERSVEISARHGVKLGPRCIPCHHNTLTFPDGSDFYMYS
jgi:radical SAM superfamily enzyme YgiQ (UPF0313 family)